MNNLCRIIVFLCATALWTSCSKSIRSVFRSPKIIQSGLTEEVMKSDSVFLQYSSLTQTDSEINIHYLGCGGFYLQYKGEGLLADPFFSNYPFFHIPFQKIRSDPFDIQYGLRRIENIANTRSVIISHAHYDHLFDTPWIVENLLEGDAKVFGSESTSNILSTVIDPASMVDISSRAVDMESEVDSANWIYSGDHFRILPVRSGHAPHYRLIIPISLYSGKAKPIQGYDHPEDPTSAHQWKVGETYSFLIDILDQGKPLFRVFLQSSASDPYEGFPPEVLIHEKPVDLALIGAASFSYTRTKQYPWKLIDYLNSPRVLICHWEDFFRPYQEQPKKFVRLTNFKKFLLQLNVAYPSTENNQFFLPEPGCIVHIN